MYEMTVKELIEQLLNFPMDAPVRIQCTFDAGFGVAGGKHLEISKGTDDWGDTYIVISSDDE